MTLAADTVSTGLPAYAHVLLDLLEGDSARSIRGDEAELGWAIVSPVLAAWAQGHVPLEEYAAGSNGPPVPDSQPRDDARWHGQSGS